MTLKAVTAAFFLLLLTGILARPAGAGLVFGGFDTTRAGTFSLAGGSHQAALRADLLAARPNATFVGSTTITPAFLNGVDVLYLSSPRGTAQTVTPLTVAEQSALMNFVTAGGQAVIAVDNDSFGGAGTDLVTESFLDPFGLDVTGTLVNYQDGTLTNPAHPVINGPAGIVSGFRTLYPGWFDVLGPHAEALGTLNANGEVALAVINAGVLSPGSGGVVFASDNAPFTNLFNLLDELDNRVLASNAMLLPEPGMAACLWFLAGVAAARRCRR